jgi:hypothetical protein
MNNITLFPLLVLWGVCAIGVIVLFVWRKAVGRNEDDTLHVLHGDALPQQAAVAHKLDVIEKWGKTLTIVTVAYGLLLAALFMYETWVQTSSTIQG